MAFVRPKPRKEMELHELLKQCATPDSLEERVKLLQDTAKTYPEFKNFLIVCYRHRDVFKQVLEHGELTYTPSKLAKGGSNETLKSLWDTVVQCYDTVLGSARIKRGKAHRLLHEVYKEDAALLHQMFTGTFQHERLSEVVVAKAFPDHFPNVQDPTSN